MQTIVAPFHPFLEDALVEEILRHKRAGALTPLLVLVPSDALRRHVKILLARQRRLPLLNLQILTFHQLALRLYAENGAPPPELRDDLFLEEMLRQMIRSRAPGTELFAGIAERVGGCAALWQTLRDLRDGQVSADFALSALAEGRPESGLAHSPTGLLRLFESFMDTCARHGIHSHADLVNSAIPRVPQSAFLAGFAQIIYYGFYDLTQIQVDLFHTVARNYPTTLLFPLLRRRPKHAAWSFADRFYERYVEGRASATTELATAALPATFRLFDDEPQASYVEPQADWRCTIYNAFGIHDEISAVAKEILRLTDTEGIAFADITVVARSLDDYATPIQDTFREHQIPIAARREEPLAKYPLAKAVLLLLTLPAKDFPRAQVIDFLSSPYTRLRPLLGKEIQPRPDVWDLATRELAICKGLAEWRRLRKFAAREMAVSRSDESEELRTQRIEPAQLACLLDLVEKLAADFARLPERGSWSRFAAGWRELIEKYLGIAAAAEPKPQNETEAAIGDAILNVLQQLAALDAVQDDVRLEDFSRTFEHWLERSALVHDRRNASGVLVLNAAAARGIGCRVLFVLGMNEGVFPRSIREDPFLRDRDRETLERDLGNKIDQKLAGFDEEKLLFTLLVNSARERLYCSFQRADDAGRALSPSWYLGELKRALGNEGEGRLREITIPRSVTEKSALEFFAREDLLPPQELAIRLTLAGEDPMPLAEAAGLSTALCRNGRNALARLDRSTQGLNEFDGLIGPLPEHWRRLSERGLSPTALETYAACPFQFFARHILGLERLELPENSGGPSAAEFGQLGHEILRCCYQHLIDTGFFKPKARDLDVQDLVSDIARGVFAQYEQDHPLGYPLAWEATKEKLIEVIRQVLADDVKELAQSGYVPISLELECMAPSPADWPEPLKRTRIRGRMDRVDEHAAANRLRVIDYKFKFSAQQAAEEKDLYRSALRGQKLQPLFYCILGQRNSPGTPASAPDIEATFYYIAPRWRGGPLVRAGFDAEALCGKRAAELYRTVARLAAGIRDGEFFLQRGDACAYCEVSEICRKNHPPSLWRSDNDPRSRAHRELRNKEPEKS